jgi:hypothetical protein
MLTVSTLLLIQRTSQARIGWTEDECREHYGKEIDIGRADGTLYEVFHVGNLNINLSFLGGKVAHISYVKVGEDQGKEFSDEEIKDLLQQNGNGCVWKPEGEKGSSHKAWYESSKELYLYWTGFRDEQPVMSAIYLDASLQEKPHTVLLIETEEYKKNEQEDSRRRDELPKQTGSPNLPEGDQFAASLTQKLDAAVSANSLFVQSLEQSRPIEEVVHTIDVFADVYDRLCAQLAQFCIWQKSHPGSSAFSATGLTQLAQFVTRSKEFGKTLEGTPQLDELFKPYILDQRIISAERRIIASYNTMQKLLQQGGVK